MNNEEKTAAITKFQREQLEKLQEDVPNILQQVDAKILLNYLKGNPEGSQVNIINVGRVESADGKHMDMLIERLTDEISMLKEQLKKANAFSILEWLETLPQPRSVSMIRSVIIALKERFSIQREAAMFFGVSERKFSYMMKAYRIPGYRPKGKRKKEENEDAKTFCYPV